MQPQQRSPTPTPPGFDLSQFQCVAQDGIPILARHKPRGPWNSIALHESPGRDRTESNPFPRARNMPCVSRRAARPFGLNS